MSAGVIASAVDQLPPNILPGGYDWPYWFRAATLEQADESPVSLWPNLGNSGFDAVDDGSNPTFEASGINGYPSVEFGVKRLKVDFSARLVQRTEIAVIRVPTISYQTIIGQNGGNSGRVIRINPSGRLEILNASTTNYGASTGTVLVANVPYIVGVAITSGGTATFYINGVPSGTLGPGISFGSGTPRLTEFGQSMNDTGAADSFTGLFSEVLMTSDYLDATALDPVWDDLSSYYGIAV